LDALQQDYRYNGLGGYQAATKDELQLMEFPGAAAPI